MIMSKSSKRAKNCGALEAKSTPETNCKEKFPLPVAGMGLCGACFVATFVHRWNTSFTRTVNWMSFPLLNLYSFVELRHRHLQMSLLSKLHKMSHKTWQLWILVNFTVPNRALNSKINWNLVN